MHLGDEKMTDEKKGLKSAFDLAMERLASKGDGLTQLTAEQKESLAGIAAKAKAALAELEIVYGKKLAEAEAAGDADKTAKLKETMRMEAARIRDRENAERKTIR